MPHTEMEEMGEEQVCRGREVRIWFWTQEHVKFRMAFGVIPLEE